MQVLSPDITQEELFQLWCDDLIAAGYIQSVIEHKDIKPFVLYPGLVKSREVTVYSPKKNIPKKIVEKKTLLEPIQYTPDRVIIWDIKARGVFFNTKEEFPETYFVGHEYVTGSGKFFSLVEVKAPPGYGNKHGSDQSFRVKQKWVWEKYNLYVNKVYNYPNKRVKVTTPYLWLSTFTPDRYFYTDKKMEPRTISRWKPVRLQEFLKTRKALP